MRTIFQIALWALPHRSPWSPTLSLGPLISLKSLWVPLRYVFAPPLAVKREELLDGNDDTGVSYPENDVRED